MFSWYKYLIVSLVFSHLGFWSGSLFLIAPFPDLCLLVLFTGTFRVAKMCPGFPPPQAARVTVVSGKRGLWVVWYNSDVVRLRNKGGKSALAEYMC